MSDKEGMSFWTGIGKTSARCGTLAVWVAALVGCGSYPSRTSTAGSDSAPAAMGRDAVRTTASEQRDGVRVNAIATPASDPAAAVPLRPVRPEDWFETMPDTGIDAAYRNGEEAGLAFLLESLGGGVALVDFDRDGRLDLFFTGGGTLHGESRRVEGRPSALFRNEAAWRFAPVTTPSRLGTSDMYTHGCSVCDYDRDGFPDLLVCGYGGVQLWKNNGDGTFEDVARLSGLTLDGWCTAAAWADIDRDGDNDLLIVRYVEWSPKIDRTCRTVNGRPETCNPSLYQATHQALYVNRGDGTFEDVTSSRGIDRTGNGLAAVAADFNEDGWCDFYVANDGTANLLYLGGPNGVFREAALAAGIAVDEYGKTPASMGVDVGDYDGDGRLDLFVTNFESEDEVLYRNLGDGMFVQRTAQTGLAGPMRLRVGFGTAMTDFDGDGWLDLFVSNGHVFYGGGLTTYRQSPQLFRNREGQRFEEVSSAGGEYFERQHAGRGVAVGDLDDDGAPDIVVVHQNDFPVLLRNRSVPPRFVRLRLRGTNSNVEAIGAVVAVRDGPRSVSRWISSGCGYFSQFDLRPIVPLTHNAESVAAVVRWPCGVSERFASLDVNRTHELVEGRGDALPPSP